MPGLYLYSHHRLENLADQLADSIRHHPGDLFTPDWIVVQTRGMERWLMLEMARRNRIVLNYRFLHPNDLLHRIMDWLKIEHRSPDLFDRHTLVWAIMRILDNTSILADPVMAPVSRYLGSDRLKTFQFADRLADCFEQYLVYRPSMIEAWENRQSAVSNDPNESWQRRIWSDIVHYYGNHHAVNQCNRIHQSLRSDNHLDLPAEFPRQLYLFGLSVLPDIHLDIIEQISHLIDIHFYLLNPCREFWFDILSIKEQTRLEGFLPDASVAPSNLHMDLGNPLLADLGKVGRHFLYKIHGFNIQEQDITEMIGEPDSEYRIGDGEPGSLSLLERIQSDILHLAMGGVMSDGYRIHSPLIAAEDRSIQVLSCYSRIREIEVILDQILDLLQGDDQLHPRDILVMTPDIQPYAPLIKAVFGNSRLNFSVADQSLRSEGRLIEAFFTILDLARERFSAPNLISLLDLPILRKRFRLEEDHLDQIHRWIMESGIRWGIDAEDKQSQDLYPADTNTWRQGLSRLLLGYAAGWAPTTPFQSIYPYPDLEGQNAEILGRFMYFFDTMKSTAARLNSECPLDEWVSRLKRILTECFTFDESTEREFRHLTGVIDRLQHSQRLTDYSPAVPLRIIREYLEYHLQTGESSRGYMTGGITFCKLIPMRSIPHRVIIMVGMNDGEFPRRPSAPDFDLIAAHPQPGDRNIRDNDNYLFLETLISARRKLIITYVGRNIQDNSEKLPSQSVILLLDYIERYYRLHNHEGNQKIRTHLLKEHPLQAFSRRYFDGTDPILFSYSQENLEGARKLLQSERIRNHIPLSSLPVSDTDDPVIIQLDELVHFLSSPVRFFLKKRLGLTLADQDQLEDIESFRLDSLDKYLMIKDYLTLTEAMSETGFYDYLMNRGFLPHAVMGRLEFSALMADARKLSDRIRKNRDQLGDPSPPQTIDQELVIGTRRFRIRGLIDELHAGGLIGFIPTSGTITFKYKIQTVVKTLLCRCVPGIDPAYKGIFVTIGHEFIYDKQPDPYSTLVDLMGLYQAGLASMIPYFPDKVDYSEVITDPHGLWNKLNTREFNRDSSEPYREWHYLLGLRRCGLDREWNEAAIQRAWNVYQLMHRLTGKEN